VIGRPKRKAIPLSVKLESCLITLRKNGLLGEGPVRWDHHPALALRPVNKAGGDYDPPQHSATHIQPLADADHAFKTNGPRHDHSRGDKGKVAKVNRIRKRMDPTRAKPKRRIPSRKFPKGQRKLRSKVEPK
jgi:hypothetical protein